MGVKSLPCRGHLIGPQLLLCQLLAWVYETKPCCLIHKVTDWHFRTMAVSLFRAESTSGLPIPLTRVAFLDNRMLEVNCSTLSRLGKAVS